MKLIKLTLLVALAVFIVQSCNQAGKKTNEQNLERSLEVELDTSSHMIKVDNTLFSLPSPYQLSLFIKEVGVSYNLDLLNDTDNLGNYTNTFKKALNLGVYGADLAYANIYEQTPTAIKYFSVLKILSQDLGLSSTMDEQTMQRIENNMDNRDSLLYIMSNAYKNVDLFLKENQRKREGALVLAGGWIEGMYFLTKIAKETQDGELMQRIGENRQPLENMIKILSPYYGESADMAKLIDDLLSLAYEFDKVKTEYTYKEPTVDVSNNKTHIHSVTQVVLSDELFMAIDKKLSDIRSGIIG